MEKIKRKALPWIVLEENGALYNTLLKKVRLRSHEFEDVSSPDLSFKQWETVKVRQIKAGSLEKLVEHLTPPLIDSECDPGFFMAFLCSYKSFSTTKEVVNLLLERFQKYEKINKDSLLPNEEAITVMKRICSVFLVWIDHYAIDFDEPPSFEILIKIITFIKGFIHIKSTKDVLNKYENKFTNLRVSPFNFEHPLKFKFCSCPAVIGCVCEKKTSSDETMSSFSSDVIAEQLTIVDAELFLRVIPRECLAYFWSKRDKSKGSKAPSIKLTVDQFNTVSFKVISTILNATDTKSKHHSSFARSKLIAKWIGVALELRSLKNFSSLKAIISGLQSTAIYRLNASWELVPKNLISIFEELADIFSDDMNSKASRDLLMQEGTAKYSSNSLGKAKSKRLLKEGVTHGTVPYLGTFLTDLMFIDTAHPDTIRDGLINFEKRRKEFEVLAQIQLLQQASKNYNIIPREDFFTWFNSLHVFDDNESYKMSIEVEPPSNRSVTPQPSRKPSVSIKRYSSETDLHKYTGFHYTLPRAISTLSLNRNYKHESIQTLLKPMKVESLSSRNFLDPSYTSEENDGVVIKVFLKHAVNIQYKSIKVLPNHRACDIIATTLRKFECEEDVEDFSLYQVIDIKKVLHIPMNSNMFYAMSKGDEPIFKVSRKKLSKKSKKNKEAQKSLSALPITSTSSPIRNKEKKKEHAISLKSFSPL